MAGSGHGMYLKAPEFSYQLCHHLWQLAKTRQTSYPQQSDTQVVSRQSEELALLSRFTTNSASGTCSAQWLNVPMQRKRASWARQDDRRFHAHVPEWMQEAAGLSHAPSAHSRPVECYGVGVFDCNSSTASGTAYSAACLCDRSAIAAGTDLCRPLSLCFTSRTTRHQCLSI